MKFDLQKIVRKNIASLVPYSSARDEFQGSAAIFMDTNENPFNHPYNRYPDPRQRSLKNKLSEIYNMNPLNIFLGNGSDEGIDLLFRAFCEPGVDNSVSIDPTYGMYEVCAAIQGVEMKKVLLSEDFSLDPDKILNETDQNTKLIFLCSPNNPTSNLLKDEAVEKVISNFNGIVVIDEAYIDFSESEGWKDKLINYPNLVILRTLSKAWGLAAIRLGMVFASQEIIQILTKIKYPYNINKLTQDFAADALKNHKQVKTWIDEIVEEREDLVQHLSNFECIKKVFPSNANFLLVKTDNPKKLYKYLVENDIIVRDRSRMPLCGGCLRITVGTKEENKILLRRMAKYSKY